MDDQKTYETPEEFPDDAEIFTGKANFEPIDPTEMYQLEISYVKLQDNPFYKPDEEKPEDKGSKYQFSFEFVVLNEGEYYGRRMWDNTGLAFKPDGKRGPTKLYKIIMAALNKSMTWDECAEYAPSLKEFYTNLATDVKGKQVRVAIENITKENGKVRTKITTYAPVKKELDMYDPEKSSLSAFPDKKPAKTKKEKTEEVNSDDAPF